MSLSGLTSPSRIRVQLGFFIDLDLVIGFLVRQVHPPYKYKGSRPIEDIQSIKNQYNYYFLSSLLFLQTLAFPTVISCSFFVSTTSEGVLGGLPILEQPYVRLP